jgi:NitT/TauT family transport system permease protein
MKRKNLTPFIPAFLLLCIILVLWETIVQIHLVSSFILPAPTEIIQALMSNWDVLLIHSWQTLLETLIGFSIAIVFGLLTAIFLDMSPWIRKAVYPLLVTSQTIPLIALAPLLLIWFGFDLLPKVIIVILACFFPITVATLDGFAKIDTEVTQLLKSMKASYWQMLRIVRFPGSLPQFFSGLKIAATYSVTAAIVGEYVGAYQGLGIYMQEMAHAHAIALVFAIIFVTTCITIALFLLIIFIEKVALPWYQE